MKVFVKVNCNLVIVFSLCAENEPIQVQAEPLNNISKKENRKMQNFFVPFHPLLFFYH